jgi:hypothetical protein
MTKMIRRSALVIYILAMATQANAQVGLVSQSRSVSVHLSDFAHADSLLAPDFGLFEETVSGSYWGWFYGDPSFSFVASQGSEIQSGHFSIHGHTESWVDPGDGAWPTSIVMHSDFEVLFEVLMPTPFSLIGTLVTAESATGSTISSNSAGLDLGRNGTPYLSFSTVGNEEIAVSENGILEPGVYTLTVKAFRYDAGSYLPGSSSFDLDFFLETPVAADEMAWGEVKALYR